MKSPKQIRSDILTLTKHLRQVEQALLKRSDISIAKIGKSCKSTATALDKLLVSHKLPEDYKVAVVGRFKAGKSSFVNELLGASLASEDTSPETAAITSFRHGNQVEAIIRFLPKKEWDKLQILYAEDEKNTDAYRVKTWNRFIEGKRKEEVDSDEIYDLPALERKYINAESQTIKISLNSDGTKKSENIFRKELKEFTSGSKPLHCLVESIEITSPAAILDEGVLLIDTPGLSDTDRFRVGLTEKAVEDVDAVLFLTKSGAAYGQEEKDFLLTLLRKGTVKQLIVVITQVDQTYEQHICSAEDNGEDAETITMRIEREHKRIVAEINATLNDLNLDDTAAAMDYRKQLGDVEVVFTSARLHRQWKNNKSNAYAIEDNDPGGMEKLKKQLLILLSEQSRLSLAAQNISTGGRALLISLQVSLQDRLNSIKNIKDKEAAEKKLKTFRSKFGEASERFEGSVKQQVVFLEHKLKEKRRQHSLLIENIVLLADQQLSIFERDDIGRHWKTRRAEYWGWMPDFQNRVANSIFPRVKQLLNDYTDIFYGFNKNFEVYLNILSKDGVEISNSLELGSSVPFDVAEKIKKSLEFSIEDTISAEEYQITAMLGDFISNDVSGRIKEKRKSVSSIEGVGTTIGQSTEVKIFYRDVKLLLAEALSTYLKLRTEEFSKFLLEEAECAPLDALNEVKVLLDEADENILASATILIQHQKDIVQQTVDAIVSDCANSLRCAENLILIN